MSLKIKKNIANRNNYGDKRSTSIIDYIVIHYTANDGDTDENNGSYFHNNVVSASAHYFVDSDSVTQSVPDNYEAWHCGHDIGGKYYHPTCRNYNSIGIEICDDNRNGKISPSVKTIANAIELTKKLMKKYNIPASNVVRHYDVTHKSCPAYWCGTDEKNKLWRTEFKNKLSVSKVKLQSNAGLYKYSFKDPIGKCSKKLKTLKKGTVVTVLTDDGTGWVKVKVGLTTGWIAGSHLGNACEHSNYKIILVDKGTRVRRLNKAETKFETDTKLKTSHRFVLICTIESGKYKGCKYAKLVSNDKNNGKYYYIY